MPRSPRTPIRDFFTSIALLVGFGVLLLFVWIFGLLVLTGLVFAGLSAFTDWNFAVRIGCSMFTAFISLKLLSILSATYDLIPESWIDAKKKPGHGDDTAQ